MYRAGIPVLAGTDCNRAADVTAMIRRGESLHDELELLVKAGLSTVDALRAAASIISILDLLDGAIAEPTMPDFDRQIVPDDGHYAIMDPIQPWYLANPRTGSQRISYTLEGAIIFLSVHETEAPGKGNFTDYVYMVSLGMSCW